MPIRFLDKVVEPKSKIRFFPEPPAGETITSYEPTFYEKNIKPVLQNIGFLETPMERIAQAQNVYSEASRKAKEMTKDNPEREAEVTNHLMTQIGENWDDYVEGEYGLLTNGRANEKMIQLMVIIGLAPVAIAHPIKLALGIGTYAATKVTAGATLYPGIQFISHTIQNRPYHYKYIRDVKELLPEEATQATEDFVNLAELIGLGYITGGVIRKAPKIVEKLTKDLFTKYKMPKEVYISAEKLKSIYQTGEKISKAELDLWKELNLNSVETRLALQKGINVKVPAEKVVSLVDKPYWKTIKGIFNVQPTEVVTVTKAGKIQPIKGVLPFPEEIPVAKAAKVPKVAKKVVSAPKEPIVEPVSEPLVAEAKKFKTAKEFVKAQKLEDAPSGEAVFVRPNLFDKGESGISKAVEEVSKDFPLLKDDFKKAVVFRDEEGNPQGVIRFVVKDDGTLETNEEAGANIEIFVNPKFRRKGIATQLWSKAKELGFDLDSVEGQVFTKEGKAFKEQQLTDIWEKAHPKKMSTIKNFDNFESKESPIAGLEKEANVINGLRLSGKMGAKEANKQIQEINKKKFEYAKEKGIAITTTQSGKKRIAIRKSGFYAKQEIVDAKTVDTYSQFQPPSSMALMQDSFKLGGEFGVIYKEVWIPTKKSIVGSIESKLKFDKEFKALMKKHNFALTKENGFYLSDMMEKKVAIPKKYKELVKEVRQYMDNKRDLANEIREKMGKSIIGYIENYVPHIQETSIWNQLIGDDVTITDNFDFIIPNQVKNPFAFKRLMEEMVNPDRNFFSLVERYNSATAKDMHINPAIENIKAYNMVLKDKGLFKSAKFWDEYIRVGLLGKQHKIDSSISVSPLVRRGLKKWKDILNKAFLAGKVSWNLATQPLSYISLTPTEAGYKNTILAVLRMFNKGIRNEVSKQSLSLRIKSQDILSDAIGEGREFANRIYRTRIDKWNDMVTLISSIEEQLLHQASYIAGLSRAKDLGYKGEDAQMFADLVAERTQSMYNKENRALILSSDITTGAIPFQSFATELSNHAKEILTKSKGAMQLTIRQRLGKLMRLLIGIWLGNQYSKALTGREKTTVGTFIPFAGETVDRLIIKGKNLINVKLGKKEEYVTTRSPVSLLQQVDSLTKAAKDYLKYGDTKRLRKLAITFGPAIFGISGGGQLSNLVDGIIADIEEEVRNVKGNRLFKVKDLESKIKAPIFGVWSTKGAREYWEKRNR